MMEPVGVCSPIIALPVGFHGESGGTREAYGLVWVRSPYPGLLLPSQCVGGPCVDVEGGALATLGGLW